MVCDIASSCILSRVCLVCRDWDHLCVTYSRSRFSPSPFHLQMEADPACGIFGHIWWTVSRILVTIIIYHHQNPLTLNNFIIDSFFPPHIASFLELSHIFVISLSWQKEVEKLYKEMKLADTIRQYKQHRFTPFITWITSALCLPVVNAYGHQHLQDLTLCLLAPLCLPP